MASTLMGRLLSMKLNSIAYFLSRATVLNHEDRILFGANHLYVFLNPNKEKDSLGNARTSITWDGVPVKGSK